MSFSIIAAVGKNRELGKNGGLIFKLPTDLKFFKDTTMGHPVLVGKRTFKSLPGMLPGRKHYVVTRTGVDTFSPKHSVASLAVFDGARLSSQGSSPVRRIARRKRDVAIADVGENGQALILVNDLDKFISEHQDSPEEIFVIGGGMIYKQLLDYADKLYLTEVDAEDPGADTFFPWFDKTKYNRVELGKGEDNGIKFTFVRYDKIK